MSIWNKFDTRDNDCRKGRNPYPKAGYNTGKQAADAYADQLRVMAMLKAEREARNAGKV